MDGVREGVVVDQPMPAIDLRSDTVSWPTFEMRLAMANAPVGDDVWGDDPTVIQLEKEAAQLLGKEAALFVSSGTQGNLISIMVHCKNGDEAILGDRSHIVLYECGGISAVAGVVPRTIPVQPDGTLKLEDISAAIRIVDDHFPTTRLICLENTHNKCGGVCLSLEYLKSVSELAKANSLKFHMDGARIFNAAVGLGVPVAEIAKYADSVTFCLSKALCAPAGSIIVGSQEFIQQARRKRKMLGGGLRQSGILAAAGLISILDMPALLHLDHQAAKIIADGLSAIKGVKVTANNTNFVFFELTSDSPLSPKELEQKLLENEPPIKCRAYSGPNSGFRFVTHHWITPERAGEVVKVFARLLQQ